MPKQEICKKYGKAVRRIPNCECSVCSKKIYRRPNEIAKGNVYSGIKCRQRGLTKNIFSCQKCGKEFHRKSKKKNYTPKYCSVACSNKGRAGTYDYGSYENKRNRVYKQRSLRLKLAHQRGAKCESCGIDNFYLLDIHHVIPQSQGGTDDLDNLKLLCKNCHAIEHGRVGDINKYVEEYNIKKWWDKLNA